MAQYQIYGQPDFAMLDVDLQPDEKMVAESGAMVAMTSNIKMKTSSRGGVFKGLKRAVLGGESFFQNTYWPEGAPGKIHFAAGAPGDIIHSTLAPGETMFMMSTAFICSSESVQLDTKWGGARGFFSGVGLFLLKATGPGDVFMTAYGAVHPVSVDGSYIVDTGHIVAFPETVQYHIRKVGGLKSLFFSGEGIVAEFNGQGTVWLQSRNGNSLASFLHPFRPVESKG
jgi:uncharacterized protein (TIGR00266 family)